MESAGTVQTLRDRKLIARAARLGSQRNLIWHTTQLFLDTFHLASIDEFREPGRFEKLLASADSTAEELTDEELDLPAEAVIEANDLA